MGAGEWLTAETADVVECFAAEPATAVPFFRAWMTSSLLIKPFFEDPAAVSLSDSR